MTEIPEDNPSYQLALERINTLVTLTESYFSFSEQVADPFDYSMLEFTGDKLADNLIKIGCKNVANEYAQKYKDNKDYVVDFFIEKETGRPGVWFSRFGIEFDESKLKTEE